MIKIVKYDFKDKEKWNNFLLNSNIDHFFLKENILSIIKIDL